MEAEHQRREPGIQHLIENELRPCICVLFKDILRLRAYRSESGGVMDNTLLMHIFLPQ